MQAYDSFTFEHNGRTFTARLFFDYGHGAPWDEECGHGPVSDWTRRDKRPGEMVLSEDRSSRRYYDFQAATGQAKVEGWGLGPDELAALAARLGRTPTAKEVTRESVLLDFKRLRDWCRDKWHYCGVEVSTEDSDETESLWGIESDCRDYIEEVAQELAEQLAARIGEDEARLNAALVGIALAAR